MSAPRIDPDEVIRLATFGVEGEVFAIDLMRVREIVRPLPVTAVPKAPFGITGAFNLRGEVLPLVDLGARFGLRDARRADDADESQRYLIVVVDGRTSGLLVDAVHEVLPVPRRRMRLGSAVLSGDAARFFVGVVTHEERLVLLMNLRRAIEGAEAISLADLDIAAAPKHGGSELLDTEDAS